MNWLAMWTSRDSVKAAMAASFGVLMLTGMYNDDNSFSDDGYLETIRETMQQIDLIKLIINKFPDDLQLALSSREATEAFRRGKIASMIGIEGLHQIGNSFSVLRSYYDLGVRYATLTHNHNNAFADSACRPLAVSAILIIRRDRMIDLSHTSEATCLDVLGLTKAPENSGIIMITFVPEFVSSDPENSSYEHVLEHIMYVGKLIGYDHIGIGSDFDGIPKAVTGLEDVSMMPRLAAGLLEREVKESDVRKILGYNLLRVMEAVEAAADVGYAKDKDIPLDQVKPLWEDAFRRRISALYPNAQPIEFD
uniref:Dipeptidase n=1 Tax=Cordyceps militaris TaxID=73501 RepID=J3S891_CORMI|nr:dipeptidase [Cordyceps militaris]